MCAAWSIFGGMPPTESLPHWTHLLGLAMLLVISAGIWYNLRGISKRFPY